MDSVRTLKLTLAIALSLVAAKLLAEQAGHRIALGVSLPLISVVLVAGLVASLLKFARSRRSRGPVADLSDAAEEAWRHTRRVVILVLGLAIIAASVPIGFLPGPGGLAVAIAGLALLATEFLWARLLLRRTKLMAKRGARQAARNIRRNPRPWRIPIVGAVLAAGVFAALELMPGVPTQRILTFAIGPVLTWLAWSYFVMVAWIRQRTEPPAAPAASASAKRSTSIGASAVPKPMQKEQPRRDSPGGAEGAASKKA